MPKSKSNLLIYLFLFFCFFPYIKIIPMETDTQPYAMIIGIIVMLSYPFYQSYKDIRWLFILVILSIIIAIFSKLDFDTFRSLFNYLSIFVVPAATISALTKCNGLSFKFYRSCIFIWLAVGIIQQFIYPEFGTQLLSRASFGGAARGIVSLAPEPTFYAIICCLMAIIGFLNFRNEKQYMFLQILLLFQIVILARSSMVIIFGLASFLTYLLIKAIKKRIINLFIFIFVAVIIYYGIILLLPYIQQYRVGNLLAHLIRDPMLFMIVDESINERFIHAYFPTYAFFSYFGLPHGYGQFADYMSHIHSEGEFSKYLVYYRDDYTRIQSGFGAIFFELGVFALIFIFVLIRNFRLLVKNNFSSLFWCILFSVILLNAMPLGNGLVGFTLGNMIYIAHKHSTIKNKARLC